MARSSDQTLDRGPRCPDLQVPTDANNPFAQLDLYRSRSRSEPIIDRLDRSLLPPPGPAAVSWLPCFPAVLRDRASASGTAGSHSRRVAVPLSIPRLPLKTSLPRSPVALGLFDAASSSLVSSLEGPNRMCPRFLLVDTNKKCPRGPSSSLMHSQYRR